MRYICYSCRKLIAEKYGAEIDDVIKSIRLAALDDCKTLLEKVLSETQDDNHKGWAGPTYGLKRALAELEALRKKVE